jgi:hypothetical protein
MPGLLVGFPAIVTNHSLKQAEKYHPECGTSNISGVAMMLLALAFLWLSFCDLASTATWCVSYS